MADDRIFIMCDTCGGWKMLLKHYAGMGPTSYDNGILEWLDTHAYCHPRNLYPDLESPGFSLHTEKALEENGAFKMEDQNKPGPGKNCHGLPKESGPARKPSIPKATDYDKLKRLLDEFRVGYIEILTASGAKTIRLKQGTRKVEGHVEFYTDFEFDGAGRFYIVGAWE